MSAQYTAASGPAKTFQVISTELSAGIFDGAGTESSARDRHSAQLLRTFQFLMPVSRLARESCSLPRCDNLMLSSDIRDLPPEVASHNTSAPRDIIVLQLVCSTDRGFKHG